MTSPENKRKSYSFRKIFGMTILVAGAVGGIVLMSIWLFDVWKGNADFTWEKFVRITFLAFFLSFIGYFILKLSPDEL